MAESSRHIVENHWRNGVHWTRGRETAQMHGCNVNSSNGDSRQRNDTKARTVATSIQQNRDSPVPVNKVDISTCNEIYLHAI